MDDLISRQAAIDALIRKIRPHNNGDGTITMCVMSEELVRKTLDDLPSAQPKIEERKEESAQNVPKEDLISRKAAIEALDALCDRECEYSKKQRSVMCGACHLGSAFDVVEQLPSAQSEIVRCGDCKHRMPYDWMFSEIWRSQNIDDYSEDEIGCVYCDMSMGANDFCSRAERREG